MIPVFHQCEVLLHISDYATIRPGDHRKIGSKDDLWTWTYNSIPVDVESRGKSARRRHVSPASTGLRPSAGMLDVFGQEGIHVIADAVAKGMTDFTFESSGVGIIVEIYVSVKRGDGELKLLSSRGPSAGCVESVSLVRCYSQGRKKYGRITADLKTKGLALPVDIL
jgi:hypothetical protein